MGLANRLALSAQLLMTFSGTASSAEAGAPESATALLTPIADIRARYESVSQEPLPEDAEALTLRARLGLVTQPILKTQMLVEGNFVTPLLDDYRADNAVAANTRYPVIADPRAHYLNRLQIKTEAVPGTAITLGRQRIELDDQRFVGSVGWRQSEQTFDALRIVNTSIDRLTIDFSYVDKVHRAYGPGSPQGQYTGDLYLTNVSYATRLGKLTAFSYLVALDPITDFRGLSSAAAAALNPAYSSTSTFGWRFVGTQRVGPAALTYTLSYADQHQRSDNPLSFSNSFYSGSLSARVGRWTITGGDEISQGNGSVGFATPLWSPHPFDGWADKFITTPANGLQNRSGAIAYHWVTVGPLRNVSAQGVYHNFAAERAGTSYGSEWDWQLACDWHHVTPSIMFADYTASAATPISVARDTKKLFVQLDWHW